MLQEVKRQGGNENSAEEQTHNDVPVKLGSLSRRQNSQPAA